MKRTLIAGAMLLALIFATAMADAGLFSSNKSTTYNNSNNRTYQTRQTRQDKNVFQRMWELEKRKNAWLRRTFFGR